MWDGEYEDALSTLKEICTSTPILAYADFSKTFILHTDVCTLGLGAILYQNQDGIDCVIRYASGSLSKMEHEYPAHKLAFLALTYTITEQFHEYLYGNTFIIYRDNNPLTCILTSANWMQQVTIGLLVWQIIILPINQER